MASYNDLKDSIIEKSRDIADTVMTDDGDFIVRACYANFGDMECVYRNYPDGNSGYPTYLTFDVSGGQMEFFNDKGEEIRNTYKVQIHFVGDMENGTFVNFIDAVHAAIHAKDKAR